MKQKDLIQPHKTPDSCIEMQRFPDEMVVASSAPEPSQWLRCS
jgi:hypothetical protein